MDCTDTPVLSVPRDDRLRVFKILLGARYYNDCKRTLRQDHQQVHRSTKTRRDFVLMERLHYILLRMHSMESHARCGI